MLLSLFSIYRRRQHFVWITFSETFTDALDLGMMIRNGDTV